MIATFANRAEANSSVDARPRPNRACLLEHPSKTPREFSSAPFIGNQLDFGYATPASMLSRAYLWLTTSVTLAGMTGNDGPPPHINVHQPPDNAPVIASLVTTAETKLLAPNGNPSDLFGFSVALSDGLLVVGTPYEDSAAMDAGAAHVFVKTNSGWVFEQKLVAPDFGSGRWFGYSVAIDGERLVVGSPKADGDTLGAGAAYIFHRINGVWTALPKIVADDGKPGDMFGQAVDITGTSVIVGSPRSDAKGMDSGAAYVFIWDENAYEQQKKLVSPDLKAGDHFGAAVAMHVDTAVIGAPEADVLGADSGTAYIFFREGNLWSQQKKLGSPHGAARDGFGWAVDIEFDTVVVGSPMDDTAALDAGAAYTFARTGISWTPLNALVPRGLTADDRFGSSVSLSGRKVVIGSLLDDTARMNAGAAYVFSRNGSDWSQEVEVLASDAAIGDAFGFAVAIRGETIVSSAYLNDDQGPSSGATYVYELKNEGGEPCATGGQCLSGFCVDGVCCDSACDFGPCGACSVANGASADGVCALLDEMTCDDGDACTQTDTCLAGKCVGNNPRICGSGETCSGTWVCDPTTGSCVGDVTPNGTICDDGDACTIDDVCQVGVCRGLDTVRCSPADACHAEGICDPTSGVCSMPAMPDETVCPGGVCQSGECVPTHEPILVTGGGCMCRESSAGTMQLHAWSVGIFLGLWGMRRMRSKKKRREFVN